MATTILAILCLGLFLVAGALFNLWQKTAARLKEHDEERHYLAGRLDVLASERDELLRQKRGTPFGSPERTTYPGSLGPFKEASGNESDKMPVRPPKRYVTIAQRRAQAEAASMGPRTHSEQIVANNARALEQA